MNKIKIIVGLLLLAMMPLGIITAATGINIIPLLATNTSGAVTTAPRLAWPLSSVNLVNGSWINSTGLNAELQDGGVGIGYMPGTGQVRMLGCFNNAAADQTTACNNATAGDITLPATGSQVYEFAADSQFSRLWLNVSTAAVGANWDLAWEYYNGATYTALTGVTDGTNELTVSGLSAVSWTFPAASLWPQSALHAVTGYWMRVRVSVFTALPIVPLGQQAYYETGRLWTTVPSIAVNEQKRFDYVLDTSPTASGTTTFSVLAGADETQMAGAGAGYPPAFSGIGSLDPTILLVGRSLSDAIYGISDVFLRFNTSILPDFISPDAATLACYVISKEDIDNRSLLGDWYNWSGTLGAKDYNSTAADHAFAGQDITTFTTAGIYTWSLQNLHQIDKAGFTGIKLSVSGAIPTGSNSVTFASFTHATLSECVLSVTYDGSRAYHNFFPHSSGYALADNAALEPGTAFEMTFAGFIDNSTASAGNILQKGTATEWNTAQDNNRIDVYINGINEVDFQSVTTGYHVLNLRQIAGGAANRLEALTDGVITGTSAGPVTAPNNATAWTLGMNAVRYQEYLEMEVAGVKQLTHQIRLLPDQTLVNQANPGTFDVTVRYPDTVAGITAVVLPLEPTGITATAGPAISTEFVDSIGELTNLTPSEHLNTPTFPLFVLLKSAADGSHGAIPYKALLIAFAFAVCVGAVMGSWVALHSVHITWFALMASSVGFIFVGTGIWPWMVPVGTGIVGVVYVFWRRAAV